LFSPPAQANPTIIEPAGPVKQRYALRGGWQVFLEKEKIKYLKNVQAGRKNRF
jgi:hypothetical protein